MKEGRGGELSVAADLHSLSCVNIAIEEQPMPLEQVDAGSFLQQLPILKGGQLHVPKVLLAVHAAEHAGVPA